MSKNESKQSYYYYPDTAYIDIDIDYTEFNQKKNRPQKFITKFNKIDLSKCSKDLKQYLLKKLKQRRRVFRKWSKAEQYNLDSKDGYYIALSQLSAKVNQIIDTDIDHINAKKRGMSRLANFYDRDSTGIEKKRDYYDEWDKVLTQAIRKLGGE